jgi:hypothetical protein
MCIVPVVTVCRILVIGVSEHVTMVQKDSMNCIFDTLLFDDMGWFIGGGAYTPFGHWRTTLISGYASNANWRTIFWSHLIVFIKTMLKILPTSYLSFLTIIQAQFSV